MAQLEDLRRQAVAQAARAAAQIEVTVIDNTTNTPIEDLERALGLLRQANTMINLVSDPELCRVVSKRERDTLTKLSGRIEEFVGEVQTALEMEGLAT